MDSGGRVRMAAIIYCLRRAGHDVRVLYPDAKAVEARSKSLLPFLFLGPRQGRIRMHGGLARALKGIESETDLFIFSISYLAHFYQKSESPVIIDFQNIESDRFRSIALNSPGLHKLSARLESIKAKFWEPRIARSASAVVGCTDSDVSRLLTWGARTSYM